MIESRTKQLGEDHPETIEALKVKLNICEKFCLHIDESAIAKIDRYEKQTKKTKDSEPLVAAYRALYETPVSDQRELRKSLETLIPQLRDTLGDNHPTYQEALVNMADNYTKLGLYDEAVETYRELRKSFESTELEAHPMVVEYVLHPMGLVFEKMGKAQEAGSLLEKALALLGKEPLKNRKVMDMVDQDLKRIKKLRRE